MRALSAVHNTVTSSDFQISHGYRCLGIPRCPHDYHRILKKEKNKTGWLTLRKIGAFKFAYYNGILIGRFQMNGLPDDPEFLTGHLLPDGAIGMLRLHGITYGLIGTSALPAQSVPGSSPGSAGATLPRQPSRNRSSCPGACNGESLLPR